MTDIVRKNIDKPREARKTEDTTFDRIWKFYYSKHTSIALNEKEERIRKRWEFAWKCLSSMFTKTEIANRLMKEFEGLSFRQAFVDIDNSKLLFGDPQDQVKKANKSLAVEWLIKAARKAYKNEDYGIMEKLVGRISKISGWENQDEGFADLIKKLKPTTIIFSASEEVLKKQAEQLIADQDQTQDIEFEDIEDQEEDED
jgi:hypothetical protein